MKRTICILLASLALCAETPADNLGLSTVVIDAGHGGKDAGCISADGKTYEKTLTLDISRRLSGLIKDAYPDVKVVMTRDKDEYITLDARAAKANAAEADLFISIHINAAERKSPNGFSVHVLGQSSNKNRDLFAGNMEVCRRENSVIMLEEDYSTKYQGFDPSDPESYIFMVLMQNSHLEQSLKFAQIADTKLRSGPVKGDRGVSQDPFYVLWKTAMPAVLAELGFISNANDLAVLRRPENRQKLAECLFDAFASYKESYDASMKNTPKTAPTASEETEKTADVSETDELWGIQIFATASPAKKADYDFLGYEPLRIKSGRLYKYYICTGDSKAEASRNLGAVRKKYPDAFVTRIQGTPERVTK